MKGSKLFRLEAHMRPPVEAWLATQGYVSWPEVPCLFGIADLVAVALHEDRAQQRLAEGPISSWGSAHQCAHKLLLPSPSWYPLWRDIRAIELKLADWECAIHQARSYKPASQHGYVALPADVLDRKPDVIADACKADGVGLLSVTPDGVTQLLQSGEPKQVYPTEVVRIAEKGWMLWRNARQNQCNSAPEGGPFERNGG